MRRIALLALLVCVVGMVFCRLFLSCWPWLEWPLAFFEAGTVGALADWFAVTALFRHPLGLPIPHTAILPKNQARAAGALSSFFDGGFLNEGRLRSVIERIDFADWLAQWLDTHAGELARMASLQTPRLMSALRGQRDELAVAIRGVLEGFDTRPFVRATAQFVFEEGRDAALIGGLLRATNRFIHEQKDVIRERISSEIPLSREMLKSVPVLQSLAGPILEQVREAIAQAVATKSIEKVESVLNDACTQPAHPLRLAIDQRLRDTLRDLDGSGALALKLRELQRSVARGHDLDRLLDAAWDGLEAALDRDVSSPGSAVCRVTEKLLKGVAADAVADPARRGEMNSFLREKLIEQVSGARPMIRQYVRDTVTSWDPAEMTTRLEAVLGRDLQFIRLNGTIIGGLIGVGIHAAFLWL